MADVEHKTIGVVIPFYQEEERLILRCVTSVMLQEIDDETRFLIVVVDDESPIPLAHAILDLDIPSPHELVCLSQPNSGPGGARNKALEYLASRSPSFIAFIDSDDVWRPDHVARALSILADDGDFFFCDHDRWDFESSYLEDSVYFQSGLSSSTPPFFPLNSVAGSADGAYEFTVDEAFYAFLQDYLAQTSTVFYRFSRCASLRFDRSLRFAGEDNMFWLELSKLSRSVRFSTCKDVATGKGMNIYAGTTDWSHPNAAQRAAANVQFFLAADRRFSHDQRAQQIISRRLDRYATEFAKIWTRKFLRNPWQAVNIVLPIIKIKPFLVIFILFYALRRNFPEM